MDKVSKVTFKVSKGDTHPTKIAHINNLKTYFERPLSVNAVTLVAEDVGIESSLLDGIPLLCPDKCPGYNHKQLSEVLSGFSSYFSDKPGLCRDFKCTITLSDSSVLEIFPWELRKQ